MEVSSEGEGMIGKKGVEHCIFKEHATRQGMKPSLERFAVRRIKQAWGKPGILLPELRRLKAPFSDHKRSSDHLLLLALAAAKENF